MFQYAFSVLESVTSGTVGFDDGLEIDVCEGNIMNTIWGPCFKNVLPLFFNSLVIK